MEKRKLSKLSVQVGHKQNNQKKIQSKWFAFLLLLVMTLLLFIPGQSFASQERYVLDFNDTHIRHYRGESATLYLKKALTRQYPKVDVSDMRLKKVVLVAKSKHGRGDAQLRVGSFLSDYYSVDGHPSYFRDQRRHSFDRVRIHSPAVKNGRGPWQVNLWGNFVVRKVIVVVDNNNRQRRFRGER